MSLIGLFRAVYIATLVLPTMALSIQPHQEPRFLIPLLIPLVLVAGRSPLVSADNGPSKQRRVFWVSGSILPGERDCRLRFYAPSADRVSGLPILSSSPYSSGSCTRADYFRHSSSSARVCAQPLPVNLGLFRRLTSSFGARSCRLGIFCCQFPPVRAVKHSSRARPPT